MYSFGFHNHQLCLYKATVKIVNIDPEFFSYSTKSISMETTRLGQPVHFMETSSIKWSVLGCAAGQVQNSHIWCAMTQALRVDANPFSPGRLRWRAAQDPQEVASFLPLLSPYTLLEIMQPQPGQREKPMLCNQSSLYLMLEQLHAIPGELQELPRSFSTNTIGSFYITSLSSTLKKRGEGGMKQTYVNQWECIQ